MTRVTVTADAEAAARRTADLMVNHVGDARMRGADVHIAVAGGSTPKRAYQLMGGMTGSWAHVHLWLGDERCVPRGHEESNMTMLDESLLDHLRAADRPKLHPIDGTLQPEDAAWLYGAEMVRTMGEKPVFDFVLLGMGPDGHTASLFPGRAEADNEHAPVIPVRNSPKPPPERISLTLPVLRRARFTVLLATGAEKADALRRVRAGDAELPAARLGEALDEIVCDEAAAGPDGAG